MSELKLISPLLDNLSVGGPISDHHGVRCYPAMDEATGEKFIVKVITIPASRTQLDAFLLSGAYSSEAEAFTYFQEQANEVLKEAQALERLSQLDGYFAYEKYQLVPLEDDIGLQVYLLGNYKHTLERLMQKQPMTHLSAVNLGLDLCAALTVCRSCGYLYTDLKPSNIFVTQDNSYKIGDLGFISLNALSYASLPDKYRSQYTAPEIADAFSNLNTTVDVYAIGRILYQIYNNGELTAVSAENNEIPAPVNADYEMSEIILKACATNPEDRWTTPEEMGQALVSYMQRNGANDIPIVPPILPVPEVLDEQDACLTADAEVSFDEENLIPEDAENTKTDTPDAPAECAESAKNSEDEVSAESEQAEYPLDDELSNLAVLLQPSDDETAPENSEDNISYDEVSQEINDILTQADEIVNHPVPDPVVAPEPIDVPMPDPIDISEPEEPETDDGDPEATESENAEEVRQAEEPDIDMADTEQEADTLVVADTYSEDDQDDADDDDEEYEEPATTSKKKKKGNWILYVILGLLLAGLITIGVYFYQNYYLLPIDSMTLSGDETSLTVTVETSIDESLITVVCKGQHGETLQAPLKNGTAEFANLKSDTAYVVTLNVSGFHKLTGNVSQSYSTPKIVNISDFAIYTGSVPGTVEVRFSTDSTKTDAWKVSYSATGESETTTTLQGTSGTIPNLTVGKKYTFELQPASGVTVKGTNKLTYTVTEPIFAELQTIDSCTNGSMVVAWLAPKGIDPIGWTVHCKDTNGNILKTVTVDSTAETTATFDNIQDSSAYTVDIISEGMLEGVSVAKPANAQALSDVTFYKTETSATMSWSGSGPWTVICTADGHTIDEASGDVNAYTIDTLVPNTTYCITVKASDGTIPVGGQKAFNTAAAEPFSCTYEGKTVKDSDLTANMCATDSVRGRWTSKCFSDTFKVGEKAGILLTKQVAHGYSNKNYTRVFAIYDQNGVLVTASSTDNEWYLMWPYSDSCELDIPTMPTKAGEYTLKLFFNNQLVTTLEFTVTE